ncbi:MAG: hypothetical protein IJN15_00260 [Clostridia bacterium]|nr:hypothetical protein [Clostridia bacterium]
MKMRFKKYASVFLCLALVLGVLLPVANGSRANAVTADKETALANLKEAWGKMYTQDTLLYPTVQKVGGSNYGPDNFYAVADGLDKALPEGISGDDLGDNYSYHSKLYNEGTVTPSVQNERFMWFSQPTSNNQTYGAIDLSGYDDIKISYYVEDVAVEGIRAVTFVAASTSNQTSGINCDITVADEGSWQTLYADDLISGGMETLKTTYASSKLGFFQFPLTASFKGWFGSLIGIKNAEVPELSGVELVVSATEFDTTGYLNTEDFTAALTVAEELYTEELIEHNLKYAWGEMCTTTNWHYPTAFRKTSGSDQINLYGYSTPTATVAEKNLYGEQTATFDMTPSGRTATGSDNTYTLFMAAKPGESSVNLGRGLYTTGTEKDAHIYIKFNSVTTEGRMGFKMIDGKSNTHISTNYIDVSKADEGKWIRLSLNELMPFGSITDWATYFKTTDYYFSRFEMQMINGAEANVTVGCLMVNYAIDVPDLSGIELVKEAMSLDTSNYVNTEAFEDALNAAKELYSKEIAIENLKSAWSEMYIADTLMSPTIEKISGTNTQSSVFNTADGMESLPAGVTADDLGDYYAYHTGVYGTTGTGENRFMWSKDPSGSGVTTANKDISVYDDLSVSFYVEEVATEGSFSIDLYTQGNTVDVANTTYNITAADEGKWITLRGDDMRVNGFDELISKMAEVNNGSYHLYFFQFGLGSNATKFKGYFGSLLGIKNADVPDLEGVELIDAAVNLDLSNYTNTENFVSALNTSKEYYAEEMAVLNANEEIKIAYNKMYSALDSGLKPAGAKVNNAGAAHIGADNIFTTAESEVLPFGATSEMLGDYYAFHDINDNTAEQDLGINSYDRILFCGRADRFDFGDGIDISEYDGFYINVYYKAVNQDGKIYTFLTGGGTAKQKSGNTLEVTTDDAGKWITYTDEDIISGGIDTIRTSFGDGVVFSTLMMCIEGGLDIEAYVGSMVFYKNIEETTLDTASDTFISEMRNVDLTNLYNKEQFINTIIDNTNELAEKYADNEEIISKIKFADDCNAYGGVDLKDLVRLARYIDDSETVKIDNLAADSNGDKAINTDDESLLRAKLLQQ